MLWTLEELEALEHFYSIVYPKPVTIKEMDQTIKDLKKEGYENMKVVACPLWKGVRY